MRLIGLAVVIGGWLIAVAGLFITSTNMGRMIFAVGGILVTLFGILGILNQYYLGRAIWKR